MQTWSITANEEQNGVLVPVWDQMVVGGGEGGWERETIPGTPASLPYLSLKRDELQFYFIYKSEHASFLDFQLEKLEDMFSIEENNESKESYWIRKWIMFAYII